MVKRVAVTAGFRAGLDLPHDVAKQFDDLVFAVLYAVLNVIVGDLAEIRGDLAQGNDFPRPAQQFHEVS